ncbi:hypothetical protein NECID01_1514 [Nematocida sp. AWRm77]|nr:hypothetical protein NECID01_1514 [Nematocida sp. AWRm77]
MDEDSHFLDIEEARDLELSHVNAMKEKLFSLPVDKAGIQKIVLEHFGEQAYYKAWVAFEKEALTSRAPPPLLSEREAIREFIERGEFLSAVQNAALILPFIFTDFPALFFLMVRQDILEDVYVRKKSEGSAILRIERELSPIVEKSPFLMKSLEDLVGEVVFRTLTSESVVGHRADVFQELNRKMLHLLDYEIKDTLKSLFTKVKDLSAKHSWMKEIKTEVLQEEL